jgi:uncharacterized protein DUF2628
MRKYDFFEGSNNNFRAVKKGFSWPALFFNWLWAILNGLPVHGIIILLILIIVSIASNKVVKLGGFIPFVVLELLGIGIVIYIGSKGNDWLKNKLIEEGYKYIKTIKSSSIDKAILFFIGKDEPVAILDDNGNFIKKNFAVDNKPKECSSCLTIIDGQMLECPKCGFIFSNSIYC